MSRPEISYRLKLIYAVNLYTILGVLKSKDKCILISLYRSTVFFLLSLREPYL